MLSCGQDWAKDMVDETSGWIQHGASLGDDWSNWWDVGKLFMYVWNVVELWNATVVGL